MAAEKPTIPEEKMCKRSIKELSGRVSPDAALHRRRGEQQR